MMHTHDMPSHVAGQGFFCLEFPLTSVEGKHG